MPQVPPVRPRPVLAARRSAPAAQRAAPRRIPVPVLDPRLPQVRGAGRARLARLAPTTRSEPPSSHTGGVVILAEPPLARPGTRSAPQPPIGFPSGRPETKGGSSRSSVGPRGRATPPTPGGDPPAPTATRARASPGRGPVATVRRLRLRPSG